LQPILKFIEACIGGHYIENFVCRNHIIN